MMEDQSLLHLAATYATRLKRIQLAERVSEIMQRRQEEEEVEENEDDEERNIHFSQSLRYILIHFTVFLLILTVPFFEIIDRHALL